MLDGCDTDSHVSTAMVFVFEVLGVDFLFGLVELGLAGAFNLQSTLAA